jgi:hypothetical protein
MFGAEGTAVHVKRTFAYPASSPGDGVGVFPNIIRVHHYYFQTTLQIIIIIIITIKIADAGR